MGPRERPSRGVGRSPTLEGRKERKRTIQFFAAFALAKPSLAQLRPSVYRRHSPLRNAVAVATKGAELDPKMGPWLPFGTTHRNDRGMAA